MAPTKAAALLTMERCGHLRWKAKATPVTGEVRKTCSACAV